MTNPGFQAVDAFIVKYNELLREKMKSFEDVVLIRQTGKGEFKDEIDYFKTGFIHVTQYCAVNFLVVFDDDGPERSEALGENPNVSLIYLRVIGAPEIYAHGLDDQSVYSCGVNAEAFFRSMTCVLEKELQWVRQENGDLDEEFLRSLLDKCIAFNNGEERFRPFYELLLL